VVVLLQETLSCVIRRGTVVLGHSGCAELFRTEVGGDCTSQALSGSPNVIGICAPAAPPIMLRVGTHSLNPIPNPIP